jgi:NADH:ubiquinone oxidoreductase subunit E
VKKIEIRICLGSSCFPRGNERNLAIIRNYIEEHQLLDRVDFRGHLCVDKCAGGPNLTIDGVEYSDFTAESLPSILEKHLKA